jgi:N-acetylglucosaminyl-diphospho-decaprenol L-rhamnosyltransferase
LRTDEHRNAGGAPGPRLAVVTVTHNSSHVIEDWIESLEQTGHRERMELCVIDSGSTPEQRAILTERVAPKVDVLQLSPNLGYGRCSNIGADASSAPAILFTNPDTRVLTLPDVVLNGGGMAGRVLGAYKVLPGGEHWPLGFRHSPTAFREAQSLVLARWSRAYVSASESPAFVSGCALLIGRPDFERIGGFCPEFFLYFEDADLCARHRESGGSVEVDAGFLVEHGSAQSSNLGDPDRFFSARDSINRLSARVFAARYGRRWYGPLLYALMALAYVPRRSLVEVFRRHTPRAAVIAYVADLLNPRRVMRRLGVPDADRNRR